MTVYRNEGNQGDGIYLVLKYIDGELSTGAYTGSYKYHGPARVYNTVGKAKAQWTRYQHEGYGSRVARVTVHTSGDPTCSWISEEWELKPQLCRERFWPPDAECHVIGWCPHHGVRRQLHQRSTCLRRKGHKGIHDAGKEVRGDPDHDPEAVEHADSQG